MNADDSETTEFEPTLRPRGDLERERRGLVILARVCQVGMIGLSVFMIITILLEVMNGDVANWTVSNWYVLPLLPISMVLAFALNRFRFCPDCSANVTRRLFRREHAFCFNCGGVLDAAQALIDPSGTVDLNNPGYRQAEQPVVKLLAMVFLLGLKDRATEVRFEPQREEYRLSYQCDGVLYDMVPPPLHLHKSITGILKAMAGLKPERLRQAGQFAIKMDGQVVVASMESEPTEFGESVIVRLPNVDAVPDALSKILKELIDRTSMPTAASGAAG